MRTPLLVTARADDALFDGGPPLWLQRALGLARPDEPRTARRAILVATIGWAPLAVLTALQSVMTPESGARAFFTDFAVHARFLLAAPLFILAEPLCIPRLGGIARHFLDSGLVPEPERVRFRATVTSTRRLLDSTWAETATLVLAYALVALLMRSVTAGALPAWHGMGHGLSPAGWWHILVSLPLLLLLFLGWLWKIALWWRFLGRTSRLDLRLVPAHPDQAAGLRFVGLSVRAFALLGFALGTIVAGTVANRIVRTGEPLQAFTGLFAGLVVFVLFLFGGPLLVFADKLLKARQSGIYQYGALASTVGWRFGQKWLAGPVDPEEGLSAPDFSTMCDLYQVASNVYQTTFIPLDLRSLALLILATLLPFVPVAFLAAPIDVIVAELAKLLL